MGTIFKVVLIALLLSSFTWASHQMPRPERELLGNVEKALHWAASERLSSEPIFVTLEYMTPRDRLYRVADEMNARDKNIEFVRNISIQFSTWLAEQDSLLRPWTNENRGTRNLSIDCALPRPSINTLPVVAAASRIDWATMTRQSELVT